MPLGFHPEGMPDNSPTLQRWVDVERMTSPEGTAETDILRPSLRDSVGLGTVPQRLSVGLLSHVPPGQRHQSWKRARILAALDKNVRALLWFRLRPPGDSWIDRE